MITISQSLGREVRAYQEKKRLQSIKESTKEKASKKSLNEADKTLDTKVKEDLVKESEITKESKDESSEEVKESVNVYVAPDGSTNVSIDDKEDIPAEASEPVEEIVDKPVEQAEDAIIDSEKVCEKCGKPVAECNCGKIEDKKSITKEDEEIIDEPAEPTEEEVAQATEEIADDVIDSVVAKLESLGKGDLAEQVKQSLSISEPVEPEAFEECDGSTNLKESMYSSIDGVTNAMYSGDKTEVIDLIKKSKGDTTEGVKEAASCLHQMTAFNGTGPSSYKELINILTKEFPEATKGDFKLATFITQQDDSGNFTTKYRAFIDFPHYEYSDDLEECEITSYNITRIAPKSNTYMIEAQTKDGLVYITGKNFDKETNLLDEAEISNNKADASNRFKKLMKGE